MLPQPSASSGNYYVKNNNYKSNELSLAYDDEKNLLYGYVDSTKIPFASKDTVPAADYSNLLYYDSSQIMNGNSTWPYSNTLHDISYTATQSCVALISVIAGQSSNFSIQYGILINDVLLTYTCSTFSTLYLRTGDNIKLNVRWNDHPDGYRFVLGIPGDGQNATGNIYIFPVYDTGAL